MFGISIPKVREVSPGKRRRTYLAFLFPFVVTIVAVLMFGSLARDMAPVLVDHARFWRREVSALVRSAGVLWKA